MLRSGEILRGNCVNKRNDDVELDLNTKLGLFAAAVSIYRPSNEIPAYT